MSPNRDGNPRDVGAVADVLARHLLAAPQFRCPGLDGATVVEVVIAEYRAAAVAGWVPSPAELAARYPDLADAFDAFFPAG